MTMRLHAASLLAPALLAGTAAAQSPIEFAIDSTATSFSYTATSSLGTLIPSPPSFTFVGELDVNVGVFTGAGINSVELVSSNAAVSPDLQATVPPPFPFLPPLAVVDVTGLVIDFSAPEVPVDLLGNFSAQVTGTVLAGQATVTPATGTPSVIDLVGQTSTPQPLNGMVLRSGDTTAVGGNLTTTFTFTDPGSMLSATINLTGNLAAVHVATQPIPYCSSTTNSSGAAAALSTSGSPSLSEADLVLDATMLPANQFCLFFLGDQTDFVPGFGGSQGNLCVGGSLVRLNAFIQSSGPMGQTSLALPYGQIPFVGGGSIQVGDTFYFQTWFRDVVGGAQTSNTTNAVEVTFAP